jgi:hypothetical protein
MRSTRWVCGLILAGAAVPLSNFLFERARADAGGQPPPAKLTRSRFQNYPSACPVIPYSALQG